MFLYFLCLCNCCHLTPQLLTNGRCTWFIPYTSKIWWNIIIHHRYDIEIQMFHGLELIYAWKEMPCSVSQGPYIRTEIPLVVMFRALGIVADRDILERIVPSRPEVLVWKCQESDSTTLSFFIAICGYLLHLHAFAMSSNCCPIWLMSDSDNVWYSSIFVHAPGLTWTILPCWTRAACLSRTLSYTRLTQPHSVSHACSL